MSPSVYLSVSLRCAMRSTRCMGLTAANMGHVGAAFQSDMEVVMVRYAGKLACGPTYDISSPHSGCRYSMFAIAGSSV